MTPVRLEHSKNLLNHDFHNKTLHLSLIFTFPVEIMYYEYNELNYFEAGIWSVAWDFQQFDISTSVDSDEPVQPPFKLRTSKRCSVSSLTLIEYSSDEQMLWSDCAYAQADLSLCWSHIPHCWKSHALALFAFIYLMCVCNCSITSYKFIIIIISSNWIILLDYLGGTVIEFNAQVKWHD